MEFVRHQDEIDLARRVAEGDTGAFNELYAAHHRRVYSLCLRILKDPDKAEDVAQDAWMQIHKKIHLFRGDARITTWLHSLTSNQCFMKLRRARTNLVTEVLSEDEAEFDRLTEAHSYRPDFGLKMSIERAVAQLPTGYKNVFVLHDIEGFEHQEIARILGCSQGTSKSQLFKARVKMRGLLTKKANPRLYIKTEYLDVGLPHGQLLPLKPEECPRCAIARRFGKVVSCVCIPKGE